MMTLVEPVRLALLVPVVAVVVGYVVVQRQRRRHALRFTNLELLASVAPSTPGWRRHVTAAVAVAAMVLLVVALARPEVERAVPRDQAVIVIALDVSLSMEATDVAPSRIDAAKLAATSFVERLPPTFQVGVVAYGGTVQVVTPPTIVHEEAVAAIAGLTTIEGTATGEAVAASLDAIVRTLAAAGFEVEPTVDDGEALRASAAVGDDLSPDAVPATVVLLSDGASADGRPVDEAAGRAAALGIPVSTITYGTAAGTVTIDGEVIDVPPDPITMEQLASATGGRAFRAATGDELAAVYEDVVAQVGRVTERQELTLVTVGLGLTLLLASFCLGLLWSGRVF